MPQRTNEFQHLVKLIHQAWAPAGAKVTESAMVTAPGFGELREIDVLVESEVSPYRMKVAVEAKDHNRKLNVTDIEAIIGKYKVAASPIVDKVVIVSRRGFAKHAVDKAKAVGIELVTLNEVTGSDWRKMLPHGIITTNKETMNFQMGPFVAHPEVGPLPLGVTQKDVFTRGRFVCRCHGKDWGSTMEYTNHYLTRHLMADGSFVDKLNGALVGNQNACLRADLPVPQFFLMLDGKQYPIERLKFHVHVSRETAPFEFRTYEVKGDTIGSKVIQRGTAKFHGHSLDLILPDGLHSKKIVVDISPTCPNDAPPSSA